VEGETHDTGRESVVLHPKVPSLNWLLVLVFVFRDRDREDIRPKASRRS
jgi:hypothetical protein